MYIEINLIQFFLEFCINKALESGSVCPMCRKDPSPIHASFALRTLSSEERIRQGIIEPPIQQVFFENFPEAHVTSETPSYQQ
jgi:hypothetical protein